MMPYYYIPLLCIFLFSLGWLFRKPLTSRIVNFSVRILAGLFAGAGAIAWTLLLCAFGQLGNAMGGSGDGAGTERGSIPLQAILLVAIIWLVPMTGFVFMFLGSLAVLKGTWQRVAYWYALIFLVIAGGMMMVVFNHHYVAIKWSGLVCLLMSVLWAYALTSQGKPTANGERNRIANPTSSRNLEP
jgi:hypothetical protein